MSFKQYYHFVFSRKTKISGIKRRIVTSKIAPTCRRERIVAYKLFRRTCQLSITNCDKANLLSLGFLIFLPKFLNV
jgi:hypothetical protein